MIQKLIRFYGQSEVPYGIFSNFPMREIVVLGEKWKSSEIFFQAMKFVGTEHVQLIAAAADSQTAADMGRERTRPLRADWNEPFPTDTGEWAANEQLRMLWTRYVGADRPMLVKDYIMYVAVLAKFSQHDDYREVLLSTKDAYIVEATKNDSYWADGGNMTGVNMLGKLLMIVRDIIASQPRTGLQRQDLFLVDNPAYFNFYLATAVDGAMAVRKLLQKEKDEMGEWANQFRLLFFIDIDTDSEQFPMPYDLGITPRAVCFDVNMEDVESTFAGINAAFAELGPHVQKHVRFGVGRFGPDEYKGMATASIFTKRMFYHCSGVWILFKNIHRRAGRFGWFYRALARRYDKKDN